MKQFQLFFELIQVAIGNADRLSYTPSAQEWQMLFDSAKKQTLIGICFYGLQKLVKYEQTKHLPVTLKLKWLGLVASIQKRNELINARCVELQTKLAEDGFRTYIMKGQGNAALYRNLSLIRQSGDIDIYLEGGFERVIEYVKKTYPTEKVNELEIIYHCFDDVEVEIHYKPFVMDSPKDRILQEFFKDEAESCFANKIMLGNAGMISVPTNTFNLVHQLVHIHHHLFYEGVGLRQLMDYYMLLHASRDKEDLDIDKVKSIISELGLNRFASALMWVFNTVFEGNRTDANASYYWTPKEKDGKVLLEAIINSGNFGKMDDTFTNLSNIWERFWYVNNKTIRYWRFDYWAWFWQPIWRLKAFLWKRINGYK